MNARKDFIIFKNNPELVYLDSAATSQKPTVVINAVHDYYSNRYSTVSRSSHFLADTTTDLFEESREKVASFLNAKKQEIIFTKNATESINLVAFGWGLNNLGPQDVVLLPSYEHNSNLLPWKSVCAKTGATLRLYDETLDLSDENIKVLAFAHVSNVLATVTDVKALCKKAMEKGIVTVIDGSQAVSHMPVDVQSIGCDFYAFSSHKMFGPSGVGVLYGKFSRLNEMAPVFYGGGTVKTSDLEDLQDIPYRFEAGTPNIEGVIGLGTAVDYINALEPSDIEKYLHDLTEYAFEKLSQIEGINILGPAKGEKRGALLSFYFDTVHSHDIAAVLSNYNIAVRSGMQCAMNLYRVQNLPSSTRVSFHVYNTKEDVDKLVFGLQKALALLKK